MKLLGIDSSSLAASCALCADGELVGEYYINNKMTHSQTLMPMTQELLSRTETALDEVDLLAVTVGPGSFTGLRIGISAVKGMCFGAGKQCVAVSTLEALAYNFACRDGLICAAMDARCQQVYTALFRAKDAVVTRLTDDGAMSLDQLEELLAAKKEPVIFVGDGAALCYNKFGKNTGHALAPQGLRHQRASSVCAAALVALAEGDSCVLPAEALEPTYLRLPQAERELLKKQELANKPSD